MLILPIVNRGRVLNVAVRLKDSSKIRTGIRFSDDKIERLEFVVNNIKDSSQWPMLFRREGVMDLVETLDYLKCLECTVVSESSINEDSLCDIIGALKKTNTREARNLSSYYQTALDNRDFYSKLSYVNKLVYDKPYDLDMMFKDILALRFDRIINVSDELILGNDSLSKK